MSDETTSERRDLRMLRFEIINEDGNKKAPIYEGNYREIFSYLKKHDIEGLKVIAVDIDSWNSMDPISAEQFLKWYELIVLPQLKDADYRSEMDVYFPDKHFEVADNGRGN
ncbi:hypothetical protein [Fodinibius sp.]|uniref:hypothetical protein n=1 Tax=Fodinibius sp. TaxID=1872440 RepID=UPI002ACE3D42|nr:hypothetical protein [Fodinibius sp.]MDZ7660677.1 hypothetical protein [Fodinibius sp.]